jgi:hypothetical protein
MQPDGEAPRQFAPLPGRTLDTRATFERCLAEMLDLLGVPRPVVTSDGGRARWLWQNKARQAIAPAMSRSPAREEWFEPLLRAAVYDPNPSFNRRLVEPALVAYGRRRVRMALLDFLRTGTDPERAGAARAWYWTLVPLSFLSGSDTPTPKSRAKAEAYADLDAEWHRTALHVFITNTDLDVRRCLLPGLDLCAEHWPEELRETVAEAIRIARTHPDEYLQQRVEHQI